MEGWLGAALFRVAALSSYSVRSIGLSTLLPGTLLSGCLSSLVKSIKSLGIDLASCKYG